MKKLLIFLDFFAGSRRDLQIRLARIAEKIRVLDRLRKSPALLVMLAGMTQWGCEFLGGAAVGALGAGAG